MHNRNNAQRAFTIGDEWLYYKLYCGVKVADEILIDKIRPLTEKLLEQNKITSWFFIRYNDPEFHLRIRFHLTDVKYIGEVILMIKKNLSIYIESGFIWDIQLNTYQREIERYGSNTMMHFEQFFFYDSTLVVKAINTFENDEERFLFTLKTIHLIVISFYADIEQRLEFTELLRQGFKTEFNADKSTIKQLDIKYRLIKSKIDFSLNNKRQDYLNTLLRTFQNNVEPIIKVILEYEKYNMLQITVKEAVSSLIHMAINRTFRSKQRLYEFMIYDFLYKHYKTEKHKPNV